MSRSLLLGAVKLFSNNQKNVIADLTSKYVAEHRQNEILRQLLIDNGIELPKEVKCEEDEEADEKTSLLSAPPKPMADGNIETLEKMIVSFSLSFPVGNDVISQPLITTVYLHNVFSEQGHMKDHMHFHPVSIVYQNVNFYTMVSEKQIATVGSTIKGMFCGSGPKHRVDIIKNISGRIQRGKMTLVMGPPGLYEWGRGYWSMLDLLINRRPGASALWWCWQL